MHEHMAGTRSAKERATGGALGGSSARSERLAWGGVALGVAAALGGCKSPESQRCSQLYESSQQVVLGIDGSSLESVGESLAAVTEALEACKQAGRGGEVKELEKAHRQIQAQHDALEQRAQRKKRPQMSPEELAELEKKGDPKCPRGQGYEHHQNKKLIRCTGPQMVEMPWPHAQSYFESRGYKKVSDAPVAAGGGAVLRMEYGAESFTFHYPRAEDPKAVPTCLVVMGAPGVPWQEVVARATAAHPARLEVDQPVRVGSRSLALTVVERDRQAHVRLGECGAVAPKP